MSGIIEGLSHVPVWVYVVFAYILYIGIKRCYTRKVRVRKLFILPAIFVVMGIRNMVTTSHLNSQGVMALAFGLVIGLLLGWLHIRNREVIVYRDEGMMQVPGDYFMLILVLAIFFIEFFINYAVAAKWDIIMSPWFKPSVIGVGGLIMGMTVGRTLTYLQKYLKLPNASV